ncbi:insertion sequence 2 OrfB protein [Shigella sonnei]|nr:insertion sequence 2 OrfB protein [Shigella sonnei]
MKTIKRDYISIMPKPDGLTAAKNLAEAFEHYNEWHPHSALGYPIKRDYISIMPKPDGLTAAKNLAEAFEHYNEWHPHSALGYRSPREYLRQRACNGLSDNRCLEI